MSDLSKKAVPDKKDSLFFHLNWNGVCERYDDRYGTGIQRYDDRYGTGMSMGPAGL